MRATAPSRCSTAPRRRSRPPLDARRRIEAHPWPDGCHLEVRFAIHTGEVAERDGDYYGTAVNRAARIRGLAVGGQVLVSEAVAVVVADHLPAGAALVDLGTHELRGLSRPERVAALVDGRRPRPEAIGGACPYRGLLAFQPEDHDVFFGRDELVASLLSRLVERRLLPVVGASGSGKSSLVRAGVVAALQGGALPGSKDWPVTILTPGDDPVARLAGGWASGGRQVLVIDQMEELFTSCRDAAARVAFVDAVLDEVDRPGGATLVVAALRADFYGHCASIPRLAEALTDTTVLLGPMSDDRAAPGHRGPGRGDGLPARPRAGGTDAAGPRPRTGVPAAAVARPARDLAPAHRPHDDHRPVTRSRAVSEAPSPARRSRSGTSACRTASARQRGRSSFG